jgi:RNA polymerase sigma factor (sigma-70 family)
VRAYLYRLIGRDAELDDLAQIVFAKAFMSLGTFRGESKVSTWLYKIAINCARNHLRGRGRRMKMLGAFEIFARSCGAGPSAAIRGRRARRSCCSSRSARICARSSCSITTRG